MIYHVVIRLGIELGMPKSTLVSYGTREQAKIVFSIHIPNNQRERALSTS
jgi:hypothetical protein